MASLEEIRNARLQKLKLLQEAGVSAYPISAQPDYTIAEAIENFTKLSGKKTITLAGRVMALRPQGGLIFFNLDDGTAKFQGLLKQEEIDAAAFDLFSKTVDIGDFVEATGTLFLTKRQEKTIQVKNWRMLAKSLLPLPEKWHGLQDVEERFRKRYLDTIMSADVKKRFLTRSQIISEIRKILDKEGFVEVETPMLQSLAGGASAEPFTTRHNALDIDLFLRIAPELYLKELLVGGFPKVYEIGRNFRNEGIDVTHNPEFTMLEYYEAYSDASRQRVFVEKLVKGVVKKITGGSEFSYNGTPINLGTKFAVISYFNLLQRYAHITYPEKETLESIRTHAQRVGVKFDMTDTLEKIIDNIYKKAVRPKIVQPTFVIDYPVNFLPLAKKSEKNKEVVDAFQLVIGGLEVVKAFSELNDPIDQRQRFEAQEKSGDREAQVTNEEYLEAMEHGMPPAGGVGIGIDRLVMLLTGSKNIREVILFPTLRPKN
ncbi:lysine--tRNA ligase [Candidatus Parcubacteria bacterium]|nr:lysine--tRNA ligase [Candidatus Parcubacteria bacterium]